MQVKIEKEILGIGVVVANELTVRQLHSLLYSKTTATPLLDRLLSRHNITAAALNESLGLELNDDSEVTQTVLLELVSLFNEVNEGFFLAIQYEKEVAPIGEILKSLQERGKAVGK